MNKTVACKLTPSSEQQAALLQTLGLFASACNAALKVAQETGKHIAYDLHHICYYDIKEGNYQRHLLKGQAPKAGALAYDLKRKTFHIHFVIEVPPSDAKH